MNGKGGLLWTVRSEKTLIYEALQAPTFKPLSNEAKVLYAFILRRTELSRKNGWTRRPIPQVLGRSLSDFGVFKDVKIEMGGKPF